MFSFKKIFTKYHFATRKLEKACKERKRVYPFLKDVFEQNLENIGNMLLKTDLKFTSIVAYNYSYFNIDDDNFRELLINNIRYRLNDLDPETAYDICLNLKELVSTADISLYENIFQYLYNNFYMFSARQIESMEKVYYSLSKQATYGINPAFGDMLELAKNSLKVDPIKKTAQILEDFGIDVPREHLDVVIHPEDKAIYIKFKKLNKTLALVGLYHEDWDSISLAREYLEKRNYDFYFMEMPPLTHSMLNRNQNLKKESILKKFIGDELLSEVGEIKRRHPYLNYFDRFDKLPVLDGSMLQWYVESVLKNEDLFKIRESERIVYIEDYGLEKPYEYASIIYQLYAMKKDKVKIMFTDMDTFDEINTIASKQSLIETRDLFKYGRYFWFNELMRWSIHVNRSGCPMCSKSNTDPPIDIMNLMSEKKYSYGIRENYMAKQMVDAINLYGEHQNFLGFYGEKHIYELLRHICKYYSNEGSNLPHNLTEEERFKVFLRQKDVAVSPIEDQKAKDEHTNKFAMLAALFQRTQLDIPTGSPLDTQLYNQLLTEYKKFLNLDSFVLENTSQWKKYKQEQRCYAINYLFHDDLTKSI